MIFAGDHESARKKGVEGLLLQYDEEGFFERVFLVSPYMRRDDRFELNDRHELWQFGFGGGRLIRVFLSPLHLMRVIVRCANLIRRQHVDLIRATEPTLCGVVAWAASRLTGIPYCISLHADYDKRFELDGSRGAPTIFGRRGLVQALERFTLQRAVRVLPIRESLVRYAMTRGVAVDKLCVIPHGIDLRPYDRPPALDVYAAFGLPSAKSIIAFAGRLSSENYVFDMLDAARRLAGTRDDFVLVLAGGGVLEQQVAALVAGDTVLARVVRILGFIPPETVRALRSACAVSLCLMGGYSLIEACAAGRPVISYDVEWHHELVIDGRTGRLLAEHDTVGVADAIAAMLDDPTTAKSMGEEAKTLAHARHSLALAQETRRRMYTEILSDRARNS